jgi:hypothetical protein
MADQFAGYGTLCDDDRIAVPTSAVRPTRPFKDVSANVDCPISKRPIVCRDQLGTGWSIMPP